MPLAGSEGTRLFQGLPQFDNDVIDLEFRDLLLEIELRRVRDNLLRANGISVGSRLHISINWGLRLRILLFLLPLIHLDQLNLFDVDEGSSLDGLPHFIDTACEPFFFLVPSFHGGQLFPHAAHPVGCGLELLWQLELNMLQPLLEIVDDQEFIIAQEPSQVDGADALALNIANESVLLPLVPGPSMEVGPEAVLLQLDAPANAVRVVVDFVLLQGQLAGGSVDTGPLPSVDPPRLSLP